LLEQLYPKRNKTVEKELLKSKRLRFSYVKIEMNNYIGNPKIKVTHRASLLLFFLFAFAAKQIKEIGTFD
jgi:hypothetical protein